MFRSPFLILIENQSILKDYLTSCTFGQRFFISEMKSSMSLGEIFTLPKDEDL